MTTTSELILPKGVAELREKLKQPIGAFSPNDLGTFFTLVHYLEYHIAELEKQLAQSVKEGE